MSLKYTLITAGSIVVFLMLLYWYQIGKEKTWEVGYDVVSQTDITGDTLSITNIHDWTYTEDGVASIDYFDESYNLNSLDAAWFIVEPFSGWQAVAHTYFVFDFANKEPLAFSIEARREKGETYDGFRGIFWEYELYYSWGTERDFTGRRAYMQQAPLYMYPLKLTKAQRINLIKQLATGTNTLSNKPRFYNTLLSNCTNELAKLSRKANQKSLPWYSLYVLPGYADYFLYDQGYIDTTVLKTEMRQYHGVTNIVQDLYPQDFSAPVRSYLSEFRTDN